MRGRAFAVSALEIALIEHLRIIGFGELKIEVANGEPVRAHDVTRTVDYRKLGA